MQGPNFKNFVLWWRFKLEVKFRQHDLKIDFSEVTEWSDLYSEQAIRTPKVSPLFIVCIAKISSCMSHPSNIWLAKKINSQMNSGISLGCSQVSFRTNVCKECSLPHLENYVRLQPYYENNKYVIDQYPEMIQDRSTCWKWEGDSQEKGQ